MSWYGFSINSELLVQIALAVGLYILFSKFFNPHRFRMRARARIRAFRKQDPLFKFGIFGTFAIFLLVFVIFGFKHCDAANECQSKFSKFVRSSPNEIGDALAGISSALAFLWIILTVTMQSKELKAQRAELEMTRQEHRLSRKISEKTLLTLEHDSCVRDQQEAWKRFETCLYQFLYAIEWHRKNRKFCKCLFGKDGQGPTTKKGNDLIEQALDFHFQIRSRKREIDKGKAWEGSKVAIKWSNILDLLDELLLMESSLPEFGKTQLKIVRLDKTRELIRHVLENPEDWAAITTWDAL